MTDTKERASERWLKQEMELVNFDQGRRLEDEINLGYLHDRYTSEIARIDAAIERLKSCSKEAVQRAELYCEGLCEWSLMPGYYEAIADVAEGIDRRSNRQHPDAAINQEMRALAPATPAEGPSDSEMLDWLNHEMADYTHLSDGYEFWPMRGESFAIVAPTLRAAIRAAMEAKR